MFLLKHFLQEAMNVLRYFYGLLFHGEMTGIDQMQFGLGKILEVCPGSFCDKRRIVLSPQNECRGTILA